MPPLVVLLVLVLLQTVAPLSLLFDASYFSKFPLFWRNNALNLPSEAPRTSTTFLETISAWKLRAGDLLSYQVFNTTLISSKWNNILNFANSSTQEAKTVPGADDVSMAVSFVNGIYHTVDDWKRISGQIEELFDAKVHAFYNPSSGWWVKDATSAGFSLALRPTDLSLARDLAAHLRAALRRVGESGRVLHLAHSGGAILTYLAAKHHLTSSEKSRIDVATFGAGKSLTRKYFNGRLRNYYSRNDPLIYVDTRTLKLYNKLRKSTEPWIEVQERKHNTSFIFLESCNRNPIADHSMEGEAYRRALRREAMYFREKIREMNATLHRQHKPMTFLRKIRKTSARLTGQHHFFEELPSSVDSFVHRTRKFTANVISCHGFFNKKAVILNAEDLVDERQISDEICALSSNEGNDPSATLELGEVFMDSILYSFS